MRTRKSVFLFLIASWLVYEEMGSAEIFHTHTYIVMFCYYIPLIATSHSPSLGCLFFFSFLIFKYMDVLPTCMSVYYMSTCCLQRPK